MYQFTNLIKHHGKRLQPWEQDYGSSYEIYMCFPRKIQEENVRNINNNHTCICMTVRV